MAAGWNCVEKLKLIKAAHKSCEVLRMWNCGCTSQLSFLGTSLHIQALPKAFCMWQCSTTTSTLF